MNRSRYPVDCYFVRRWESPSRKTGGFQRERFQSSETFVTINSSQSIWPLDLDTSSGCVDFANGSVDLNQRSAIDFSLLTEPGSYFEVFVIWKKQSEPEPTIAKFIDLLVAEVK